MGYHSTFWRLQSGDHISYLDENGTRQLLKIIGRKHSGYRVFRIGSFEDDNKEELTDTELNLLIVSRNYTHHPGNISKLDETRRHLLFMEWEHFSPKAVFEARDYRAVIVGAVERARSDFRKNEDCINAVLDELWPEHAEGWSDREHEVRLEEHRAKLAKARDPALRVEEPARPGERKKPHWRTVLEWWTLWRMAGRDARVLLPLYDRRGRRDPRFAPIVYELMEKVVNELWLKPPKKTETSVWDTFRTLCEAEKEVVPHRTTLGRFIRAYVNDRDENKAIYGWRSAFLRFTAHPPVKPPERPLEQVEIDHCLLDIYVRDERTGKLLGRPWLTVIIDRRTRVICGIHLSWELPSYASVQRALSHAILPKDLTGYTHLKNDWPVFGVPDIIFTDNGREFKSMSLAEAKKAMHFQVVRLRRKRPWLKGRIERAFRTIQVQVYSHQEGAIVYGGIRDLDHYDPQKSTEVTLGDVQRQLLNWIVDVYHQKPHSSLRGPQTGEHLSPIDFFKQEVVRCGVRPPRSFSEIIQLIGAASTRTIQKTGVKLFGLTYWDRRLSKLLERRGGREKRWQIRVDPFDIGRLWLFDDDKAEGGWLQIECTRPDLADGVSIYQHRQHRKQAYRNKKGGSVTDEAVARAKRECEERFRTIMAENSSVATAAERVDMGTRTEPTSLLFLE